MKNTSELKNAVMVEITDYTAKRGGQYDIKKLKNLPSFLPDAGLYSTWERIRGKQKSANLDDKKFHPRDLKLIAAKLSMVRSKMKMVMLSANKDKEKWITVRGNPVLIEEGQTKEEAVKNFIAKKQGTRDNTKSKASKSLSKKMSKLDKVDKNGFDIRTGVKVVTRKSKLSSKESGYLSRRSYDLEHWRNKLIEAQKEKNKEDIAKYAQRVKEVNDDLQRYSKRDDLTTVREEWNKISPEYKKHVKKLVVKLDRTYKFDGWWTDDADSVTVNARLRSERRPPVLIHEVAHSFWEYQSEEKNIEFDSMMRKENVGPVSKYSGRYVDGEDLKIRDDEITEGNKKVLTDHISTGKMSEDMLIYMSNTKNWITWNGDRGLKPSDYENGGEKIKEYIRKADFRNKYIYANEQHSEYMRIKFFDTDKKNENWHKIDKIYKKVFGDIDIYGK